MNGHEGIRVNYEFHNWQTVTSIAKDHSDLKMLVTIYQLTQHNKPDDTILSKLSKQIK